MIDAMEVESALVMSHFVYDLKKNREGSCYLQLFSAPFHCRVRLLLKVSSSYPSLLKSTE